jgi:hypothetical protein
MSIVILSIESTILQGAASIDTATIAQLFHLCQQFVSNIYHCLHHSESQDLTTLGNPTDNAIEFNVIGIVGLNIRSQSVERPLQSLLGRRIHHSGLNSSAESIYSGKQLTYCGASSGHQLKKVILFLFPSPPGASYSTSNTAYLPPIPSTPFRSLLFAFKSFSRKTSYELSVLFSSTSICFQSSLILKMIHLRDFPSFSSLKTVMHSGLTVTPEAAWSS